MHPVTSVFRALCLCAVAVLTFLATPVTIAADTEAPTVRTMALTFDDLPFVAASHTWTVPRARRVTVAILDALNRYGAPATAFVNEAQLHEVGEFDARTALLQQWVDAGAILGNHTFSHADLNSVSIDEFMDDIVRGDTVTRRLMAIRAPYQLYFRHPYTHTGDTDAKKIEIERFLAHRGYKVTPHTIDSHDFIFNSVYLDSKEQGNDALARRVCEAYLDFVVQTTDFAEEIAIEIFGRTIPQTMLLHANDINADCLGDLLHQLTEWKYEFVSLDTAMADPAYDTPDTLVTQYGPTWLWRWMKSQDMTISFSGDPEPPDWIVDLYRQTSQPVPAAIQ